jgi:putative methyltransferase (TIGR04325 family)
MAEDRFGDSMNIDNPNDFKIFPSWRSAAEFSQGYEDKDTIEDYKTQMRNSKPWERQKSVEVTERELQLIGLFSLIAKNRSSVNIIDLGGGNGYMCHLLRLYFPLVEINYTIWESPGITYSYQEFSDCSKITYTSEAPDVKFDIAISSCTLQCLEFPEIYLKSLMDISSELIILRFPELHGLKSKYAVQESKKVESSKQNNSWPIRFFGKGELDGILPNGLSKNLEFCHYDETYLFDGEKVMLKGFHYSIM